jgi:hypothetical protein
VLQQQQECCLFLAAHGFGVSGEQLTSLVVPAACCVLSAAPQIPCRGRGESPDPLAVNMAVWEIRKALSSQPNLYILVHCTHGFNRSGACRHQACLCLHARVTRGEAWLAGPELPPTCFHDVCLRDAL